MEAITLNKTPYGVHLQENNGIGPRNPNVRLFVQCLYNGFSFSLPFIISLSFSLSLSLSFYRISFFSILSPKSTDFSDVTSCSLVEVYRLFGESYCFHLQSERVNQASKHQEVNNKFSARFPLVACLA
jgi:hypothetical protein